MAAADTTHVITCPSCKARFAVVAAMAGRRARCAACSTPFTVPAPSDAVQDPLPAPPVTNSVAAKPQFISVECRVCGTRLTGRVENVGKKIKCPDCGAGTAIPEPLPPKPKNIPAALEGDQYELWDTDDQPLPSELIARQPKFIAVPCSRCGSLMHASEFQVGQQIACPDCGAKHVVPIAPRNVARPSVLASDRETPQIDPATIPGVRPHLIPRTLGQSLAEQEAEAEYKRALEKSLRTGRPMEIDERGRPILPSWPLISGILPFLFSSGLPAIWLGLSVGFMVAGWVFVTALQMAMSGGMGAIAGMCFFAIGCVMVMLCGSACSCLLIQVITDSSTGSRQIHDWPSFLDWFGSALYVVVGGMISALPGWAVAHIPPLSGLGLTPLLTAVSVGICFPIITLSQLDNNSSMGILSGRVLASMKRCPFSWAFFYFECALIVAICAIATVLVGTGGDVARLVHFRGQVISFIGSPLTILWLMPLYVAALVIWARLLGRLGWLLAETVAIEEPPKDEDIQPRKPKNYNPPRQPRAST